MVIFRPGKHFPIITLPMMVTLVIAVCLTVLPAVHVAADPRGEKPETGLVKSKEPVKKAGERNSLNDVIRQVDTNTKARGATSKSEGPDIGVKPANFTKNDKDFETYLDRLMMAESGGKASAKNPRSTALGPFQFIRSTFLYVARRYLADEVKGLSEKKILALRTDMKFARRAARAYSRENAAYLAAAKLKTTYGNLRLAFLLGPSGAVSVLSAKPKAKVSSLLGRGVIRSNPFMAGMTAKDLIERSIRDISIDPSHQLSLAGLPKVPKSARIRVRCNLSRPSCKRWLALKRARLRLAAKIKARKSRKK